MFLKLRILFTILATVCLVCILPALTWFGWFGFAVCGLGALLFFGIMLLCKQNQESREEKKNVDRQENTDDKTE